MKTDTIIQLRKICDKLELVFKETDAFNYFLENDNNVDKTIRDVETHVIQAIKKLEALEKYLTE